MRRMVRWSSPAIPVALAGLLAVCALVVTQWPEGSRSNRSATVQATAVLRQSLRRLTGTAGLTYDMQLQVRDGQGEGSDFSVAGSADGPSPVTTGTVQLSDSKPAAGRSLRFVLSGRRLFLVQEGPEGDPEWREVDLVAALRSEADSGTRLLALAVQRPTELAAILLGVRSARELGSDNLDDEITTRYQARVSFPTALSRLDPTADPDVLKIVTDRIDGDEIDLDAWVDGSRQLRALALGGTLDGRWDYTLQLKINSLDARAPTTLPNRSTAVDVADLSDLFTGPTIPS
jgi:hypothetical protein